MCRPVSVAWVRGERWGGGGGSKSVRCRGDAAVVTWARAPPHNTHRGAWCEQLALGCAALAQLQRDAHALQAGWRAELQRPRSRGRLGQHARHVCGSLGQLGGRGPQLERWWRRRPARRERRPLRRPGSRRGASGRSPHPLLTCSRQLQQRRRVRGRQPARGRDTRNASIACPWPGRRRQQRDPRATRCLQLVHGVLHLGLGRGGAQSRRQRQQHDKAPEPCRHRCYRRCAPGGPPGSLPCLYRGS